MDRDQTRQRGQYQGDRHQEDPSYRQADERAMTDPSDRQSGLERSRSMSSGSMSSGETGGEWQRLVVPYRYYGPGYAGVGYYAVYYQGGADQRDEGEDSSSGFDQRSVRYGQGQGAGAAWPGDRAQNAQNQATGGYAGRGPRGYRRSDERIQEEISDRLMEHDELDASDIEVTVKDGEATLKGTVDSRRSKRLAEDLAERASGVRDVMNQLKVSDQSAGQTGPGRTTSSGQSTSRSKSGGRSGTRSRSATSNRNSGSEMRQPVGSGVGGATDGAPPNGSTQNPSSGQSGEPPR